MPKTGTQVALTGAELKGYVIEADTVNESTPATGVTIDSVLLKDGEVGYTPATAGDWSGDGGTPTGLKEGVDKLAARSAGGGSPASSAVTKILSREMFGGM